MSARGRRRGNVVFAPISRWLLWSPWHLGIGVAAVVVVAVLISALLRPADHKAPVSVSSPASPSSSSSVAASDDSSTMPPPSSSVVLAPTPTPAVTISSAPVMPASAQDRTAAATVASRWVGLWARPTLPALAWRAALRPSTYDDYARQLTTVDPRRVPASRVAGKPTLAGFAPGAAQVHVPVAGGVERAVTVTVIFYPMTSVGRWLVNGVRAG